MGFLVAASNIGPITLSKVWFVYRFKVHLAFLYTRQRPKPKMKSKWVQNHQQHETVRSTVCVIQQATALCFPSPPKCLSLNGVQLSDPKDCSPPGSSVHGTHQARILEWVAIPFSRGSSWPRDQIQVSCVAGRFFTIWATWEAPYVFDWENAIALDTMHWNLASSHREGKVSWVFSSCGRNLGYILELRRGCPF